MARFGDEAGFFWEDIKAGNLPGLPKDKGGGAQSRAHRGRAGNAGTSVSAPGTPSWGPPPESTWTPPTELPRLHQCRIGVDVETRDMGIQTNRGSGWCFPDGGEVVGVAVAWSGGRAYYPFAHPESTADQLSKQHVLAWLRDVFLDATVECCFYNAAYDIGWLEREGCGQPHGLVHDGFVMASLLNEHRRSYRLDNVAKDYGLPGKDQDLLNRAAEYYHCTDVKAQLHLLPARYVGPYGEGDAREAMDLVALLLPKIQAEGLDRVYALEMAQIPILMAMRNAGVKVDVVGAELKRDEWRLRCDELRAEVKRVTQFDVPMWESSTIAMVCDREKIPYPRTAPSAKLPTGQPSFTAAWLVQRQEPWLQHIAEQRKLDKAVSTFVEGYILDKHVNGRVHCTFNPLRTDDSGTVSGRYSSSYPNLQNIPTRDKQIGPVMRGMFLPEDGEFWCAADYSQQEPRLTVHYADVINCIGARHAVDEYTNNPAMDYHKFMALLTGLVRDHAKTINLAAAYGMGALSLCKRLGLPTIQVSDGQGGFTEAPGEEGLSIMQRYHANAPFVKQLSDACSRKAKKDGVIRTIAGRRARFPAGASHHTAMNRLIQGSAADMMKSALKDLWRERIVPLVTVHDEVGVSVPDQQTGDRIAEIMRATMPLRVPLLVDAGLGINWWEAKHVED